MRRLVFTGQARESLDALQTYIALDSPRSADKVVDRILQSAGMLAEFPMIGREGVVEGTRELVVPNVSYRIVYRVEPETVVLNDIVHTSRRWPPDEA